MIESVTRTVKTLGVTALAVDFLWALLIAVLIFGGLLLVAANWYSRKPATQQRAIHQFLELTLRYLRPAAARPGPTNPPPPDPPPPDADLL